MTTAYLARRLPIDPSAAPQLVAECESGRGGRGKTTHARCKARLRLAPDPELGRTDDFLLVQRRGVMWIGLWPVRVHLECTSWSQSECELGLRPANLRWPVGRERYVRAGIAALEAMVDSIKALATPAIGPQTVECGQGEMRSAA